ncbi:uncharacterized protein [Anabrus simplex]|uniref:uncharacterized protein n=1 Tax=Anabrus simplex TaxID=316456 RepID=UPI0035A2BA20
MNDCMTCYWVNEAWGHVDDSAVLVGVDEDGGYLYVGRAAHEGDLLPAKVAPTHQGAFVAYNGREHSKFHYELLTVVNGSMDWQKASDGDIPARAFPVGWTKMGEDVYVGRVPHQGTVTPGKIVPSEGTCNISFGGVELRFTEYEVLVL